MSFPNRATPDSSAVLPVTIEIRLLAPCKVDDVDTRALLLEAEIAQPPCLHW
jgi:hypothetical protein